MQESSPTQDEDQDALVDALAQTAFVLTSALNRIAADNDLSITQLRLLGTLRGRSPQMKRLADHLGLEKSTLSGLIDRAERRGVVQRRPSESDKRVVEVTLTPDGESAARRIENDVRLAVEPIIRRLDAADRDALRVLLERMLGPAPL